MNRPVADKNANPNGRNISRLWGVLAAVAVLVVGAVALVQAGTPGEKMAAPSARYVWAPPTTGSAVAFYRIEVLENDQDKTVIEPVYGEEVTIQVAYGNKYLARVAAVDAAGNQGPWSIWSVAYAPELDPPVFNP